MSCTGGDTGGVGGGRKLGNHPLPPLGRMAGTKRERPSQRLQGGGGVHREQPGGTLGEGVPESLHRAHPRDTHTSLFPLRPLPEQLSFTRPKTPSRIGSSPAPGPLSPGIPAENQLRAGGAGRVDGSPSPLPTHSQSPPTASRRFPGHRSARFWRPESRRGDPGAPRTGTGDRRAPQGPRAGGTGVSEPTLLASSLLRSIRARVRDSIRDIIRWRGAPEDAARTQASGYCGGRAGEGSAPHASVWGTGSLTPLARHPAPVPQTRVSTPARAQERGRRGGGRAECRAPDRTPRSVEGQLARVQGAVDWQSGAGVCMCACLRGGGGSLAPAASAAVFLKPSLALPVALTPRSSSPSPSPPPKQSISLERPAGRRIPAVPSSPGNPDQFLPGLRGPIKAGQSRPTPLLRSRQGWGEGGEIKGELKAGF